MQSRFSLHSLLQCLALLALRHVAATNFQKFNKNHRNFCPIRPDDTLEDIERDATDEYIDYVIDKVAGVEIFGDVIRPYKPDRIWLLSQWGGTVLKHGMPKALSLMTISVLINAPLQSISGLHWFAVEINADSVVSKRLHVFFKVWRYLMSLTTFILTFFLTNAYSFWKDMYNVGRGIQGRFNDINFLLATHAKRRKEDGSYTPEARALLEDVGANLRLFHMFLWGSASRHFRVLLTRRGLKRMVERGILTKQQMKTLRTLDISPLQKHVACLEWAVMRIIKARSEGGALVETAGEGFNEVMLSKFCMLRGIYGTIGDLESGRMPLPYAHFVQFLVDSFLLAAPFALHAELGSMSTLCVGILTLFYGGLLDLAKIFLDPLENEDYCDGVVEIDLGVLIRESNAASVRWKDAAETLPPELQTRGRQNTNKKTILRDP